MVNNRNIYIEALLVLGMPHLHVLPPNSLKLLYKLSQVREYSRVPTIRGEQEQLLGLVYTGPDKRVRLRGQRIEQCDASQVAAAATQLFNRAHQVQVRELPAHDESELEHFAQEAQFLAANLEYHILEDVPSSDRDHPHFHYGAYAAHGPRNPHLFLLSPKIYIKARVALERVKHARDTLGIRYNWIPLDDRQQPPAHQIYDIVHALVTPELENRAIAAHG